MARRQDSHSLAPAQAELHGHGVAHPRLSQTKLPRQQRKQHSQFPDGRSVQETPGGHPSALPPGGHHLPLVQVAMVHWLLDEVRLTQDPLIAFSRKPLRSVPIPEDPPSLEPRHNDVMEENGGPSVDGGEMANAS